MNHQIITFQPWHGSRLIGQPGIDKVRIMGAFVESHDNLAIFDLDLAGNIQQTIEKLFRSGIVIILRKMPGK